MTDSSRPSRAQENVLVALVEGWRLRYDEEFRWSLLQPHRDRVFCKVRTFTVREMTEKGWLTRTKQLGLGSRPAKMLTDEGRRQGLALIAAEEAGREERLRHQRLRLRDFCVEEAMENRRAA